MSRRILSLTKHTLRLSVSSIVICLITVLTINAQTVSPGAETKGDKNAPKTPPTLSSQDTTDNKTTTASAVGDDQYLRDIYRRFYESYKLGPEDEIAVRVQ